MVLGVGYSKLESSVHFAVNDAFTRLAGVTERLATLRRINRGSDDPAGLIAAEGLSSEIAAYETAMRSFDRTRAFSRIADSGLANAGEILNSIQSNLVTAADDSLSPEAKDALQYEIDAGLDALNRIGQMTVGGRQVFGSTFEFLAGADPTETASLTLPAIDGSLGNDPGVVADLRSGGAANALTGDLELASNIVEEARNEILSARAEVGAFEKYVVDSTQRVMQDTEVNLTSALSAIRDADIAEEGSKLVREMVMAEASIAISKLLLRSRRNTLGLLFDL